MSSTNKNLLTEEEVEEIFREENANENSSDYTLEELEDIFDDDPTQPLNIQPDDNIIESDVDIDIGVNDEVLDRERDNIKKDNMFKLGRVVYKLREGNGHIIKTAIINEVKKIKVDPKSPIFMMLRLKNEYDGSIKYRAVRYSLSNLATLLNMTDNPGRAWEIYHNTEALHTIESDVPRDIARFRESLKALYKATHIGIYNQQEKTEFENSKLAAIFSLFPNINSKKTRRVGRFMCYKMLFDRLAASNSPTARYFKKAENNLQLEIDYQIPWFSGINLLKEDNDGDEPIFSEIYSTPCFLYSLKNQVPDSTYKELAASELIHGAGTKMNAVTTLCKQHQFKIKVYRICKLKDGTFKINNDMYPRTKPKELKDEQEEIIPNEQEKKKKKKWKKWEEWETLEIMFWEGHYMRYQKVLVDGEYKPFIWVLENAKREGLIEPYNGYEYSNLYENYSYDEMIKFNDKAFIRKTPNGHKFTEEHYDNPEYKQKKHCKNIWFADFEASTNETYHVPYLIAAQGVTMEITKTGAIQYTPIKVDGKQEFVFWGAKCAQEFLDFLLRIHGHTRRIEHPDCRVYFHNLHYDFTFIQKELHFVKPCTKSNKLYSVKGVYGETRHISIDFWDSLPLFQTSLKNATNTYLTEEQKRTIKKEVFPYRLYTYEFFKRYPDGLCPLDVFCAGFDKREERNEFLEDLYPDFADETGTMVRYKDYANFYCLQDVHCLKAIMMNFANLLYGNGLEGINGTPPFNMLLWNYRTASSIGYDYFLRTVFFKKEGKNMVPRYNWAIPKGALRAIIQKSIRGGRVMVRDNKQCYYKSSGLFDVIVDYDGVSLYPSAMSLLWITDGVPEFIKGDFTERDFVRDFAPPEWDGGGDYKYFDGVVHVTFMEVHRYLHFPLLSIKDPITKLNDYRNIGFHGRDDYREIRENSIIDTWINVIDLYNLVDFQRVEFKWDAAVVWTGTRRYEIRESITNLFNFRKDNKRHPIQLVTKLMMNSIFGKSILKVSNKEKRVIDRYRKRKDKNYGDYNQTDNWKEFFRANMYRIHKFEPLGDDKVEVELYKRDVSSSLNIFGSNVLAMARRIIGRVMALAEEVENKHPEMSPGLFYTDTDSMHIRADLLELVEAEYMERYGKPIKGTDLTQFHIDFDAPKNFKKGETVVGATESFFILKKMYADRLVGSEGSEGFHMRMKGIPSDLVHFDDYKKIFRNEMVTFDLLDGHTSFFYKNGHVGSRLEMKRTVMNREAREMQKAKKRRVDLN